MKASASAWAYAHAATGTRCGKKILSLLLALVVCLTLLPTAVMAEEGDVAEVITSSTEAKTYSTLQEAFDAVKNCTEEDNATINLLSDIKLTAATVTTIDGGTFTLALNNHSIMHDNNANLFVITINSGTVTLSGEGSIGQKLVMNGGTLNVNGGTIQKLFVKDSATLNMAGGNISANLVVENPDGQIRLSGGSYACIQNYANTNKWTPIDLLTEGYAYQKDGQLQALSTLTGVRMESVSVVKCPHTGETSSPCKYCNTAIYKTITFHTNGGTLTGEGVTEVAENSEYTMQYEVGKGMTLPNSEGTAVTIARPGYRFAGWYKDDEDFTDGPYSIISADSNVDFTFYANWESLKPDYTTTITVKVRYDERHENMEVALPDIPAGAAYGVCTLGTAYYKTGSPYEYNIFNSGGEIKGSTLYLTVDPVREAGVYADITVDVTGVAEYNRYVIIVHLVYAIAQDPPAAPQLESSTTSSITLKAIEPNDKGTKAQYRINGGAWQDSPEFKGLSAGTTYTFEARYAETEEYIASPASAKAQFATQSGGGNYYYRKPDTSGTEGKKPSATTGDVGILAYGLTALGSYTGTALMLRRKKHED